MALTDGDDRAAARRVAGPQARLRRRPRPEHRRHGRVLAGAARDARRCATHVMRDIMQPVVRGLAREGIAYTRRPLRRPDDHDGRAKVLEFNVRFGDPEAQVLLMRLRVRPGRADGRRTRDGTPRRTSTVEWDPRAAACVVLAAEGYPGAVENGRADRRPRRRCATGPTAWCSTPARGATAAGRHRRRPRARRHRARRHDRRRGRERVRRRGAHRLAGHAVPARHRPSRAGAAGSGVAEHLRLGTVTAAVAALAAGGWSSSRPSRSTGSAPTRARPRPSRACVAVRGREAGQADPGRSCATSTMASAGQPRAVARRAPSGGALLAGAAHARAAGARRPARAAHGRHRDDRRARPRASRGARAGRRARRAGDRAQRESARRRAAAHARRGARLLRRRGRRLPRRRRRWPAARPPWSRSTAIACACCARVRVRRATQLAGARWRIRRHGAS